MTEFDPAPEVDETRRWHTGMDTFDRVYAAALGVTSPTTYTEIAKIADCAPNTAKKHLERLADMGIVRTETDNQRYERNEGYLEWQTASQIAADLTVEEIIDRVRSLEAERKSYEAEFETADPAAVSVFDQTDHDTVHERMVAVSDWRGLIRDIRLYELARRLNENDGHLVSA